VRARGGHGGDAPRRRFRFNGRASIASNRDALFAPHGFTDTHCPASGNSASRCSTGASAIQALQEFRSFCIDRVIPEIGNSFAT
jgi:hypothetical protein